MGGRRELASPEVKGRLRSRRNRGDLGRASPGGCIAVVGQQDLGGHEEVISRRELDAISSQMHARLLQRPRVDQRN
jgi:hypothetical protein